MSNYNAVAEVYRASSKFKYKYLNWTKYDDDLLADCKAISLLGFEPLRIWPNFKLGFKIRPDLSKLEHAEYVQRVVGDRWLGIEFAQRGFYVKLDYKRPSND